MCGVEAIGIWWRGKIGNEQVDNLGELLVRDRRDCQLFSSTLISWHPLCNPRVLLKDSKSLAQPPAEWPQLWTM